MWTAEHEAHNKKMHERQEVLAKAWEGHMAAMGDASDDDFNKGWQKARVAALEAAGMSVPFPTWE